jgi:hypothetical protein
MATPTECTHAWISRTLPPPPPRASWAVPLLCSGAVQPVDERTTLPNLSKSHADLSVHMTRGQPLLPRDAPRRAPALSSRTLQGRLSLSELLFFSPVGSLARPTVERGVSSFVPSFLSFSPHARREWSANCQARVPERPPRCRMSMCLYIYMTCA